jgi:hypothetical protein
MTSARLLALGIWVIDLRSGFASISDFLTDAPILSIRWVHLPYRVPPSLIMTVIRCRTIPPACHRLRLLRPRLRTRLTLGRLTLPRNPQAFGVSGSCRHDATHSGIRTSFLSTSPCDLASLIFKNAPLPSILSYRSRASVPSLSLVTLSVPLHSTSELLRTLSMVAASKPTSWLLWRGDCLSH